MTILCVSTGWFNNEFSQAIADIENNTAKELTKLGAVIQVPFRAGNQFLGEGGLQVSIHKDRFLVGIAVFRHWG